MPEIFPFKGLRPSADFAAMVAAKSTDFKTQNELVEEMKSNPFSFHHVTKNHLNYSGAFQEPEKFLPFAARFVSELKDNNTIQNEEEACFYIYHQTRADGREFEGIVALCKVEDYRKNLIRKHEEIRPSKINFLVELFRNTKVMGEPALLTTTQDYIYDVSKREPIYSFHSIDGKKHSLFKISDGPTIQHLQEQMETEEVFYIADGHHRTAAIEQFDRQNPEYVEGRFMCLIVREKSLEIKPFHRLIKPYHEVSIEEVIHKLSKDFVINHSASLLYSPLNNDTCSMYVNEQWYHIKLNDHQQTELPMVVFFEEKVVKSIFEIEDSRTDGQINFHPHDFGVERLTQLVDSSTYDYAFCLPPCAFDAVRNMADNNEVMPPKSTSIEPKLRSGLIIQEFIDLSD